MLSNYMLHKFDAVATGNMEKCCISINTH